jgi:hypothetical protein
VDANVNHDRGKFNKCEEYKNRTSKSIAPEVIKPEIASYNNFEEEKRKEDLSTISLPSSPFTIVIGESPSLIKAELFNDYFILQNAQVYL